MQRARMICVSLLREREFHHQNNIFFLKQQTQKIIRLGFDFEFRRSMKFQRIKPMFRNSISIRICSFSSQRIFRLDSLMEYDEMYKLKQYVPRVVV